MEIWEALVLGIIQGLSEFLPISSSGHLLLIEKLGFGQENLFFNVMLHVGTLAAVLIALRKTWIPLVIQPFGDLKKLLFRRKNAVKKQNKPRKQTTSRQTAARKQTVTSRQTAAKKQTTSRQTAARKQTTSGQATLSGQTVACGQTDSSLINDKETYEYQRVFGGLSASKIDGYLVLACVPTVAFAFAFKLLFPDLLEGKLLGCGFVLTAVLLYAGENFNSTKSTLLTPKTSILTGVLQGIAVLPGVSRSGATISALTLQGVEKKAATTFSFLLSIPIILGSALYESLDLFTGKATLSIAPAAVAVGVISAFLSGLVAIKFFLKLIEKHSMTGFVIYTLLLGIAVSVYPFFV